MNGLRNSRNWNTKFKYVYVLRSLGPSFKNIYIWVSFIYLNIQLLVFYNMGIVPNSDYDHFIDGLYK